jgi:hypothetical protein
VSDAIIIARAGTPAVALITERFVEQGRLIAGSRGMSGLPQVALPYPIAGTGVDAIARAARGATEAILAALSLSGGA